MLLERMLENALSLQAIPAPTGQEGPRAARLCDLLTEAGLDQIEHDDLGNLYGATAGSTHPIAVVSAHLDSVFPPTQNRPAERRGSRLIGPGIGDNALGLSALIELAYDLQAKPVHGCVWLVANVAEEGMGNLEGMRGSARPALPHPGRSRGRPRMDPCGSSLRRSCSPAPGNSSL